jgi:catechol 2,3-dioxygenase-like lactoylglutathione lyase family enzyme
MFLGTHLLLYSRNPEADRAFFRDVLELPAIDAGHNWLIFALPPAEMAVHPAPNPEDTPTDTSSSGDIYLICRYLDRTIAALAAKGVTCGEIHQARWGEVTTIPLPGGGKLGLYEPRHPLAIAVES